MTEIYADIVFLINFFMDILIFWIVEKLLKTKIKKTRLFLGSFISTLLFCLIIFIPSLNKFYNFTTMLAVLIIGIKIIFKPPNLKGLIKITLLVNISSFCVGGMAMAVFYFTNINYFLGNITLIYAENFSLKLLLIISSTTFIFIKLFSNVIHKFVHARKKIYEIKIHFKGEEIILKTLLDTGNSLCDPLTKSPVIITEFEYIKDILPNDLKVVFYENKENDLTNLYEKLSPKISTRIRVIPFESVGKQNGMLIGFKPDKVEIFNDSENYIVHDVIIGIYNYKLSKDNLYQGLLNPELIPAI